MPDDIIRFWVGFICVLLMFLLPYPSDMSAYFVIGYLMARGFQ